MNFDFQPVEQIMNLVILASVVVLLGCVWFRRLKLAKNQIPDQSVNSIFLNAAMFFIVVRIPLIAFYISGVDHEFTRNVAFKIILFLCTTFEMNYLVNYMTKLSFNECYSKYEKVVSSISYVFITIVPMTFLLGFLLVKQVDINFSFDTIYSVIYNFSDSILLDKLIEVIFCGYVIMAISAFSKMWKKKINNVAKALYIIFIVRSLFSLLQTQAEAFLNILVITNWYPFYHVLSTSFLSAFYAILGIAYYRGDIDG